jgi:hypothetical protein
MDAPEGFTWSGTLEETDIRSIYGACHSLRFSGWLELKDPLNEAKVLFLGGDPVEISGGDTERISMWRKGSFRAVQQIPNLDGELTDAVEVTGSLAAIKPSALWTWISQYRLTCDIALERPGGKALVVFQNGHAESAQVNGMPELAALARVSSWTDGSFHVRLRPLFSDGVVVAIPFMPDSAPSDVLKVGAKQFDFSRAVPLLPAPHTPRVESTARTRTGSETAMPDHLRPRAAWPWLVTAGLLLAAGGVLTLYEYHLPPFSPPPKPITEPPLVVQTSPSPTPEATPEPKVVEQPKKIDEPKKVEKLDEPKKLDDDHDKEVDKLLQKGRLLLVSGHSHTAAEVFRKAMKLRPKDKGLGVYEQQALGKLGHGELLLEGKGSAVVDGKKFSAPKKLKLAAGPHVVDSGEGESELTLKRGEKKKLRLKK